MVIHLCSKGLVAIMKIVRQILEIGVFPALFLANDTKKKANEKRQRVGKKYLKKGKAKTKSWQAFVFCYIDRILIENGIARKNNDISCKSSSF